ncbi:MAG: sodium:alanine symporter family protein, partial [Nitrospirae bacterium]
LMVIIGAFVPLKLVWNFSDIANILMALPNLVSLILLSGVVKSYTDEYFKRLGKG